MPLNLADETNLDIFLRKCYHSMIREQHLAFDGEIAIYQAQNTRYSFWKMK